ncbi:unnamed protein product [Camellia sinensis]
MTAIVLATAIPLALFVVWNAVILGSITSFEIGSDKIIDPLQQLQSANRVVGLHLQSIVKNLHHRVVLCWLMKKLVSGEAGKKKKKKKPRLPLNAAEMQWKMSQDLAAENYMMPRPCCL